MLPCTISTSHLVALRNLRSTVGNQVLLTRPGLCESRVELQNLFERVESHPVNSERFLADDPLKTFGAGRGG